MSLRCHIVGCSRDARLCWGLMAAVLMLGEGRTPGRKPTLCVALMGVAPISGLWRREASHHPETKRPKVWSTWWCQVWGGQEVRV